jgi:hypothetical protein
MMVVFTFDFINLLVFTIVWFYKDVIIDETNKTFKFTKDIVLALHYLLNKMNGYEEDVLEKEDEEDEKDVVLENSK